MQLIPVAAVIRSQLLPRRSGRSQVRENTICTAPPPWTEGTSDRCDYYINREGSLPRLIASRCTPDTTLRSVAKPIPSKQSRSPSCAFANQGFIHPCDDQEVGNLLEIRFPPNPLFQILLSSPSAQQQLSPSLLVIGRRTHIRRFEGPILQVSHANHITVYIRGAQKRVPTTRHHCSSRFEHKHSNTNIQLTQLIRSLHLSVQ